MVLSAGLATQTSGTPNFQILCNLFDQFAEALGRREHLDGDIWRYFKEAYRIGCTREMLRLDKDHIWYQERCRRSLNDEAGFGRVDIPGTGVLAIPVKLTGKPPSNPAMTSPSRRDLAQLPSDELDVRVLPHVPDVIRRQ
ncbi:MAG: hypothetical protein QOF33_1563 [Thermomicrobiales bacterium]|nr:hypothetical protein [Thermomicrobiales bacterium]